MNIRIGYYGKDENVHSTFAKCMNVLETAKYLETVAETWEDAKRYVHLIQDNMMEHWGVDGYGDPLCTCLLYTSPSPRDLSTSRMPSSA